MCMPVFLRYIGYWYYYGMSIYWHKIFIRYQYQYDKNICFLILYQYIAQLYILGIIYLASKAKISVIATQSCAGMIDFCIHLHIHTT